jgi:hypothetical protein
MRAKLAAKLGAGEAVEYGNVKVATSFNTLPRSEASTKSSTSRQ